jgi:UDP-N-acetylglucosamine 2-epimerase (non-hydrolysing)
MIDKFTIIFGTRPEFLKVKCLINEFQKRKLNFDVIYVCQHKHIDEFIEPSFKKLIIDDIINERLSNIGSEIVCKLPELIQDSTHILIQGDTATAFYCALTGFQLRKKIIHIEAGLRTYDLEKPFPEEAYRQMISRIANINFTPHLDSSKLLIDEKVCGDIVCVGNTILDLVSSYKLNYNMDNIVVITFHRRENWDKIESLLIGINKLIKKTPHLKFLWYLHPNPELQNKVITNNNSNIQLMKPCNHIDFTYQLSKCNFIITDSGGIQEEASFMGKHCIVLRESTERNHIPKDYITLLKDFTKLDEIYDYIPKNHLPSCNVYGQGNSSKLILDYITKTNKS